MLQPHSVILALLIGTIHVYHFISHSVALTLADTKSLVSKTSWLHYLEQFWTEWNEVRYGDKPNQVEHLLLSEIYVIKGNNKCLLTTTENSDIGMQSDIYELIIMVWNRYDDKYYWSVHCDTSLGDFDTDSRSQGCEKVKTSVLILSQSFYGFVLNFLCFETCLSVDPHIISSCLINIEERELSLGNFVRKKNVNVCLHSDIYRCFFFQICEVIEATRLCCLKPVWMTLTFLRMQLHEKVETSVLFFLQISQPICGWNVICYHDQLVC